MAVELVTGKAGAPHVDSEDVGAFNAYTLGAGAYILNGCEATRASNNSVRVSAGELLVQGRHVRITGTGETLTIQNGSQAAKRNDLICVRYEKQASNATEAATLVVIKGTPSTSAPADPDVGGGNILQGSSVVTAPLFRVALSDLVAAEPVELVPRLQGVRVLDALTGFADYPVSIYTAGDWRVERYKSGRVVQILTKTLSAGAWEAWGALFYARNGISNMLYPVPYVAPPSVQVTVCGDGLATSFSASGGDAKKTPQVSALRPDNAGNQIKPITYHIQAEGVGL